MYGKFVCDSHRHNFGAKRLGVLGHGRIFLLWKLLISPFSLKTFGNKPPVSWSNTPTSHMAGLVLLQHAKSWHV